MINRKGVFCIPFAPSPSIIVLARCSQASKSLPPPNTKHRLVVLVLSAKSDFAMLIGSDFVSVWIELTVRALSLGGGCVGGLS